MSDSQTTLASMLKRQTEQQRNWQQSEVSQVERARVISDLLLGLYSQVDSLQRLIHTGYHVLRAKKTPQANVTHGLVDVLKYTLAIASTLGISADELAETFWSVSDAVDDRWRCEQAELSGELVVAVDIDECLADFVGGFTDWCTNKYGRFDVAEIESAENEPKKTEFYATGGFSSLRPIPGAAAVIRDFRRIGVKVVIITARPRRQHKNVEPQTIEWLRRHGIEYDLIIFERDKSEALCEYVLPATVLGFVEDRRKHAVEIAMLGVSVLWMVNSAETDREIPDALANIQRVTSWDEIRSALWERYHALEH